MPQKHACVADAEGTDYVDSDRRDCTEDDYSQQLALKREQDRLQTFRGWSSHYPVKPEDLARDGFYCLNIEDRVKCIFCNLVLKSWERGDSVRNEHKKFNASCPFLLNKNVGNVPLQTSVPGTSTGRGGSGLVPKFPEYSKPAAREGSYRNLPETFTQSVDELVEAGFFYLGQDDCVRCFHCGIVVRNWEPTDDPRTEHQEWSPNCHFLASHPIPTEDVFEVTPVIKRVLSMGYDKELVKSVVRRRRRSGESEFSDINKLVDAVEELRVQQDTVSKAHGIARKSGVTKETGAAGGSQGTSSLLTSGASSVEDQYQQMKDQKLCKICMEREVEVTFIPCGHFVACEHCGAPLKKCPICRKLIRSYVKTFMS